MKNFIKKVLEFLKSAVKAGLIIGAVLGALCLFYFLADLLLQNKLSLILRVVLENFIIFSVIIAVLYKTLNVSGKMEDAKQSVEQTVNDSETAKVESEKELSAIEESINHLEDDINSILAESDDRANLVGANILEDAKKAVLVVKDNAEKALENSTLILKNDLIRRAAYASVEVAKAHIIEELEKNKDLHTKLIDESINAIEGVELK